jgi:cytoskeletal protein CcmA (bactofilin family)
LSYFSQSKGERDTKNVDTGAATAKPEASTPARKQGQEMVSTLGPGLLITGNVISTGSIQIFGRVIGDIHAAQLLISKGAKVEGKVMAQDAVIDGDFKGTIHSNSVKLQATAVVEGEIFNNSLVIEQNAQFEGVARRLSKPVEAPTSDQINAKVTTAGTAQPMAASSTSSASSATAPRDTTIKPAVINGGSSVAGTAEPAAEKSL